MQNGLKHAERRDPIDLAFSGYRGRTLARRKEVHARAAKRVATRRDSGGLGYDHAPNEGMGRRVEPSGCSQGAVVFLVCRTSGARRMRIPVRRKLARARLYEDFETMWSRIGRVART